MKSQFLIWLSALALLVLIVVQSVFITETYRTKKEQFNAKFGRMVKDGMISFNNQGFQFGLDSVLYILDNLAVEYLFSDPDSLHSSPARSFHELLNNYRDPETFLWDYIRKAGEEPVFSYYLQINSLFLLDMGYEEQVYPDTVPLPVAPYGALLAGSYTHERNFFRISYDIYINFTNRSKLILNEMWRILALSIFTLLMVFMVFYITLRNLYLQKRLSEMKTDFINNMTHELKTPLSTIAVASSSLGNRSIIKQEHKVEELSGLIKRQNKHLSELIDRILDINIWEKDQVHMSTVINNLFSNAVKYGNSPCKISSRGYRISGNKKGCGFHLKDKLPHPKLSFQHYYFLMVPFKTRTFSSFLMVSYTTGVAINSDE